jgi:streptogramin lyase
MDSDLQPVGITNGPKDSVWFTGGTKAEDGSFIGRVDLSTHGRFILKFGTHRLGTNFIASRGSDLWMTKLDSFKIERYNATTHALSSQSLPTGYSGALGITVGSDQQLWFTNLRQVSGAGASMGKLCPNRSDDKCAINFDR